MSLGLRLLATLSDSQSSPEDLIAQVADWLQQKFPALHPVARSVDIDSVPTLLCKLHPAAEEVELSLISPKRLVASANTTTVGPGYHVFLTSLLKDFAQQFGASWEEPPDEADEYGDETGYFFTENLDRLQSEMTAWLAGLAEMFFDGSFDSDSSGIALCLPMNPQFESTQLAMTPLGPRDREWLRRTAADGNRGADFFSWWEPGFTAPYFLGRALTQMWTDVRWRPPVNEQEELVLSDIANCLKSAYELDPNLDYPWAEWKQILELLGRKGQEAFTVNERSHDTPSIGYRRTNVTVALPGGWSLRIPGSFTDFEVDEQGDLSAIDPPREIWFTAYRMDGADPSTFEKRKGEMEKSHSDQTVEREDYFAQATISERKKDSGEPYFVLNSANLAIGTRCVCTFLFPTLDQKELVLGMWRSLQPPSHQVGA